MTTLPVASLVAPKPFQVDTEGSSNSSRWDDWNRRMSRYLSTTQVTDDAVKINKFLWYAGETIDQIYHVNSKTGDKFDDVLKIIKTHFSPYQDTDACILEFRQTMQMHAENIESYVMRLRAIATKCDFTTRLDQEMKLQIATGATAKKVRDKGRTETPSLADLVKFAEETSIAAKHDDNKREASYAGASQNQACQIRQTQPRQNQAQRGKLINNPCPACGYELPHKGSCPAVGQTCHNCSGKNHFTRVCKTEKRKPKRNENIKVLHKTAQVEELQIRAEILDELRQDVKNEMEQFGDYYTAFSVLSKNSHQLCNGHKIREVLVFKNVRGNLLSYEASLKLNLLKMTFAISEEENLTKVTKDSSEKESESINLYENQTLTKIQIQYRKNILEKFHSLFSGKRGTMRGVELKLHIDPDIKPTQVACRPIPIHLREKLDKELDRMIMDGTLEPDEGPTTWISELVI